MSWRHAIRRTSYANFGSECDVPDGTVEFYGIQSLDLLPVFRDNFVENFEPRYWGRIDNCGEDYNNR